MVLDTDFLEVSRDFCIYYTIWNESIVRPFRKAVAYRLFSITTRYERIEAKDIPAWASSEYPYVIDPFVKGLYAPLPNPRNYLLILHSVPLFTLALNIEAVVNDELLERTQHPIALIQVLVCPLVELLDRVILA